MTHPRTLIVVFDALRPEFLRSDLMPNLCQFAGQGVRYTHFRSTYPTETRVNQSAVTTGCLPRSHGIVGNKFVADDLQPGLLVNSGDDAMLARAFAAGPVLTRPSMGQLLTRAGRSFVSLSAGTPGGGRLINWSAEADASHRLAMRNPGAAVPAEFFDQICAAVGSPPEYRLPASEWIGWAVSAYLEYIEPVLAPDLMLLWLCEPDESFHWHGIGSPESLRAIRHADRMFGRILVDHARGLEDGSFQIVAMSDHGQLTVTGPPLDLVGKLGEIGVTASRTSLDGADCVLSVANAGGIWVRDRDPDLTARLVDFLRQQDWCGPIFSRTGVLGTLSQSHLMVDHARAPDITLALRNDARPSIHGLPGSSLHDSPYPEGGGCHGGLSPWELTNVLALGGARFKRGQEISTPAGNADILPTVLTLSGLKVPEDLDGRVLDEAFLGGPDPKAYEWAHHVHQSSNRTGPRTMLEKTWLGRHGYLDRAWVET